MQGHVNYVEAEKLFLLKIDTLRNYSQKIFVCPGG